MVQLFTPSDSPPEAPESTEQPIGFVIGRSSPAELCVRLR